MESYDAFICTLYTDKKEQYENVHHHYALNFATLAKQLNIPYFSYLKDYQFESTSFRNSINDEAEGAIRALDLEQTAIFEPVFITNTWGKRFHGLTALKSLLMSSSPFPHIEA